jgi:hypothetical protein
MLICAVLLAIGAATSWFGLRERSRAVVAAPAAATERPPGTAA